MSTHFEELRDLVLANALERLHPNEGTGFDFLMRLLKEPPNATEEWDSEDLCLNARELFDWLRKTRFSHATHPRLYFASSAAQGHDFFVALESMDYPAAATMSFFIKPRWVPLVVVKLNK